MILETRNLNKWYRQVAALNDVTLSAGPGIVGLLGPNGSGKTTLMRLAAGLMRPSSGSIRVLGEPPWGNPDLSRRIGYTPEHDGLYESLTGMQFVRSLLRLRGFGPGEAGRRAREAIERVGLTNEAGRRIRTYSHGMRQRIKFAQAIAHDPELLILDEPLSGADPIIRGRLVDLIHSGPARGAGVLVSSHILHEVEQLTRSVILIHRGRLLAEGDVHEIRALIDRHPHTVHIRTTKARALATAFTADPSVVEISFPREETLCVRTRIPDEFYDRLPSAALEAGCDVSGIFSPDDNLEAVFRYLTEK